MKAVSGSSGGSTVSRISPGRRAAFHPEMTPSRKKPLVSVSGKHLGATLYMFQIYSKEFYVQLFHRFERPPLNCFWMRSNSASSRSRGDPFLVRLVPFRPSVRELPPVVPPPYRASSEETFRRERKRTPHVLHDNFNSTAQMRLFTFPERRNARDCSVCNTSKYDTNSLRKQPVPGI